MSLQVKILRDAPEKKCSSNLGIFHNGGGGFQGDPKVFGHFFVPQQFWNFGLKRGGGLTKSKSFLALFPLIFGELWHKKYPKSLKQII